MLVLRELLALRDMVEFGGNGSYYRQRIDRFGGIGCIGIEMVYVLTDLVELIVSAENDKLLKYQ